MENEDVLPNGMQWNEAVHDLDHMRGLIAIVAFSPEGRAQAMGSGFIIAQTDQHVVALTAAHVLKGVLAFQSERRRHHPSAVSFFLPPPPSMQLHPQKIMVARGAGQVFEPMTVQGVLFDEGSDVGILNLTLPAAPAAPVERMGLDTDLPPIGSFVSIVSLRDLGTVDGGDANGFTLKLAPVSRVGRVIEHHPDGTRLCKGPCITTSIPVYSGMSGGAVLVNGPSGSQMRVFGIVCSDADVDGPKKEDRHFCGSSVVALIEPQLELDNEANQIITLRLAASGSAGVF